MADGQENKDVINHHLMTTLTAPTMYTVSARNKAMNCENIQHTAHQQC